MGDLLLRVWCSSASRFAQLQEPQRGATAVEYAIMVALIATVIIAVVKVVGLKSRNNFNALNSVY
jgi:Flp pilus assembly pilin Flp